MNAKHRNVTHHLLYFTYCLCIIHRCTINVRKKKEKKKKKCRALTSSVCSHHLVHAILGSVWENYSKCLWNICVCSDLGKFLKVILKRRHKVSFKFHPEKKAPFFFFFFSCDYFLRAFPLSKAPMCAGNWRLGCLHGEMHKRSLITKPNWVLMWSLCISEE